MWTNYKKLFNRMNINTIICVNYNSHYEALKIPKTATHKEIKDAYYRLSMIYHPDKNKGSEEAAKIFRNITSAYEVLGNVRQRKIYDTGIIRNHIKPQYNTKQQPFGTMNTETFSPKNNLRSRDYNFDDWSKAHYSNIIQQQHTAKQKIVNQKFNENAAAQQRFYTLLILVIFSTLYVLIYMFEYVKYLYTESNAMNRSYEKKTKSNN